MAQSQMVEQPVGLEGAAQQGQQQLDLAAAADAGEEDEAAEGQGEGQQQTMTAEELAAEAGECCCQLLEADPCSSSGHAAVAALLSLQDRPAALPPAVLVGGCCLYLESQPPSWQPPPLELRGVWPHAAASCTHRGPRCQQRILSVAMHAAPLITLMTPLTCAAVPCMAAAWQHLAAALTHAAAAVAEAQRQLQEVQRRRQPLLPRSLRQVAQQAAARRNGAAGVAAEGGAGAGEGGSSRRQRRWQQLQELSGAAQAASGRLRSVLCEYQQCCELMEASGWTGGGGNSGLDVLCTVLEGRRCAVSPYGAAPTSTHHPPCPPSVAAGASVVAGCAPAASANGGHGGGIACWGGQPSDAAGDGCGVCLPPPSVAAADGAGVEVSK